MYINTFAYAAVDAIQNSKKQFVTTFVKHDGISDTLNAFVDAQAAYTKSAIDAGVLAATTLGSIFKNEVTKAVASTKKGK